MTDGTAPEQRQDAHEHWGVIGVGQAGGNIASRLFTRDRNPGIDDRILIVNTNDAEIQRNLDRVDHNLQIDRETITRDHIALFGASHGVGNDFLKGELKANEGFDEIYRPIENTTQAEALLYATALGGGTGNGATPYIVDQCSQAPKGTVNDSRLLSDQFWLSDITQFVLAAWPFENEPVFRHFNAVCGLSRLLFRSDGTPSADMTLLVSNTRVKEIAKEYLRNGFERWKSEHGLSDAGGSATLVHVSEERSSMDVLAFLAGFDLDQLLEGSWEKYEAEKERFEENVDAGEAERIDRIDKRIRTYVGRS